MIDFNIDFKQYIPKIYVEGKEAGCGIFIGDYFITDAHVISPCLYHYVEFEGRRLFLNNECNVYFRDNEKDPLGYDLAVYKFDNIMSPFVLENSFPECGNNLIIPFYDVQNNYFTVCTANVTDIREGNYFGVNSSKILSVGNSGSPIIQSNRVYGLLNGGKPGDFFCIFLSSKSTINQLKNII